MRRDSPADHARTDAVLPAPPPCLTGKGEKEVVLAIYVQPRASRTRVTGLHDGNLRLAITAPPLEGQANRQVISFLAKLFRVPKSSIAIIGGEQGRTKRLLIAGISISEAGAVLEPLLREATPRPTTT